MLSGCRPAFLILLLSLFTFSNAVTFRYLSVNPSGTIHISKNSTLPSPTLPNLGPLVTTFTAPSSCTSIASQWVNIPQTNKQKSTVETLQSSTPLYGGLSDCYPPGFYDATYSNSLMPRITGFTGAPNATEAPDPSLTNIVTETGKPAPPNAKIGRALAIRADESRDPGKEKSISSEVNSIIGPYYSPGLACPTSYFTATTAVRDDTETRVFCCPTHYALVALSLCRRQGAADDLPLATHSFNGTVYTSVTSTASAPSAPSMTGPPDSDKSFGGWNTTYVTVYALAIELRHKKADYEANNIPYPKERKELPRGAIIGLAVGLTVGLLLVLGVGAYLGRLWKDRKRRRMIKGFKDKARETSSS